MDQQDPSDELLARASQLADEPSLEEIEDLTLEQIQAMLHDLWVHEIELEMQNEELRKTQAIVTTARDKYSELYNSAPVGYCTLDERGFILECNNTLSEILKRPRSKLLNHPFGQFVDPEQQSELLFMLKQPKDQIDHTMRLLLQEEQAIQVQLRLHRTHSEEEHRGRREKWLASVSDISTLHELTVELKVKSRAIETTMEGIVITNERMEICYVNPAFEETTGYPAKDVLGKNPSILQSGRHPESFYRDMWQALTRNGHWRGEIWNRRASGSTYPEWLSISTIFDRKHRPLYYVGVFSDITREAETRERLHQLAYFDGVTTLPNRHLFSDRLNQELAHARRYHSTFSLLFMDLDRFKAINDTLGHSAGDQLLVQVSERLRGLLREIDTIARMGGDEFMMLLPGTHSSDDTRSIAEKVLASMAVPFDLEGREYHISISIGISRYPEDGLDAETLIKHADIAMYQAKEQGRNTYSSFSENLTQKISRKVGLENDLRDALRHDQLKLHYQPQKNLIIDRWYGVEALLRWRHPEKGMIPPDEFIGIAEETGLIVKIGDWVLRRAAEQYLAWRAAGIDVGPLSVNLSPHQFLQSNLVERIRAILHETGMPSTQLGIEVTESAAMPNFQHSIRTMESLRDMGIAIYIDDFGTGFSSLSHLRHLPIDALKIDRAFIDELPHNADDVAIAQAIIAMAKTLNLRIIAEGVETPAQLDFLKRHGCHSAQGFFLSRPVPAERISELLGASQQA